MPSKVTRSRATLGPRGRLRQCPRALVDEALARIQIAKYNRLAPLAKNADTSVGGSTAFIIESYSTKHIS